MFRIVAGQSSVYSVCLLVCADRCAGQCCVGSLCSPCLRFLQWLQVVFEDVGVKLIEETILVGEIRWPLTLESAAQTVIAVAIWTSRVMDSELTMPLGSTMPGVWVIEVFMQVASSGQASGGAVPDRRYSSLSFGPQAVMMVVSRIIRATVAAVLVIVLVVVEMPISSPCRRRVGFYCKPVRVGFCGQVRLTDRLVEPWQDCET